MKRISRHGWRSLGFRCHPLSRKHSNIKVFRNLVFQACLVRIYRNMSPYNHSGRTMQSNPVSQDHRCESQIPIEAQAKGRGAKTYGQTMEPLDIETFLASLPAPLDSHPLVRHLVEMVDVTTRAATI